MLVQVKSRKLGVGLQCVMHVEMGLKVGVG